MIGVAERHGGKTMAQMGFFDLSDRSSSLDAKNDPLVEIDAVVPWEEFRPTLEPALFTGPLPKGGSG